MTRVRPLLLFLIAGILNSGSGAVAQEPKAPAKSGDAAQKAPADAKAGSAKVSGPTATQPEKSKAGSASSENKDGELMDALWNAKPSAEVMRAQAAAIAAQQGLDVNANLVDKAVNAYQRGDYEGALKLLTEDLREHPTSGTTHFYLSRALKKLGKSDKAVEELETAARLVPKETIASIARYVLKEGGDDPFAKPTIQFTVPQWMQDASNGVSGLFGGKPAKPATFTWTAPDMGGPFNDMRKGANKWIKDIKNQFKQFKKGQGGGAPGGRGPGGGYESWAAETVSMADILALVEKSHTDPSLAKWSSHPEGVAEFHQAPENIPEWDYWISRFKRSFQSLLLSNLARDATDQVGGKVWIVFSVDKNGNLRGHLYSSTADDEVLNKCAVKAIKRLDRSRILAFPPESRVTGWNFTMEWDLRILLNHIRRVRFEEQRRLAAEQQARLEVEARLKKAQQDAALKAKQEKLKEDAKKLADAQTRLKLIQANMQIKTNVSGMIVPKAGIKAKQLTLADMAKMPINNDEDPFGSVDDQEIMSMPDLTK